MYCNLLFLNDIKKLTVKDQSSFLSALRCTNPTEYRMFRQYSLGINVDFLNMNHVRNLEIALRDFDQHARQASEEMLVGGGFENVIDSHYATFIWAGKYLKGGLGPISEVYSSINTLLSINSLPEVDPIEASNIATNGRAVMNQERGKKLLVRMHQDWSRSYIPSR